MSPRLSTLVECGGLCNGERRTLFFCRPRKIVLSGKNNYWSFVGITICTVIKKKNHPDFGKLLCVIIAVVLNYNLTYLIAKSVMQSICKHFILRYNVSTIHSIYYKFLTRTFAIYLLQCTTIEMLL